MNFIVAFILTSITAVSTCHRQTLPETIRITKDACVQRRYTADKVSICFNKVLQDSRCPRKTPCIWAGMVVVRLALTVNNKAHVLTLSSNKRVSGFAADTTVAGYKIALVDLFPYPGDSVQTPFAKILIAKN